MLHAKQESTIVSNAGEILGLELAGFGRRTGILDVKG